VARSKKVEQVIEKYPDLKGLPEKLAVLAFRFREELLRERNVKYMSSMANARCLDPEVAPFIEDKMNSRELPSDLPGIHLINECIVCRHERETLTICADCWRIIRRCLKLKGEPLKEGWDGWGFEMNLDLSNIVRTLKSDKEGKELLKTAIANEHKIMRIQEAYNLGLERGIKRGLGLATKKPDEDTEDFLF